MTNLKFKTVFSILILLLFLTGCNDETPEYEMQAKFESYYDGIESDLGGIEGALTGVSMYDTKTHLSAFKGSLEVSKSVYSELVPPDEYKEAHELWLNSIDSYIEYANLSMNGEDASSQLSEATDYLISAKQKFDELN